MTSVYTSGIEVLLFIGLALKVSGFLVRDEMILRALGVPLVDENVQKISFCVLVVMLRFSQKMF